MACAFILKDAKQGLQTTHNRAMVDMNVDVIAASSSAVDDEEEEER